MTRHKLMTHEEAIEMLPWLVNGSLDEAQYDVVAAHAANCVTCRRELEELEVLQQSINVMGAQYEPPAPDMRRINARIDAQLPSGSPGRALLAAWQRLAGSRWRVAFAVQSIVLLVVAGILLMPREPQPEFSTLSDAEDLPAGQYLRVVFDPTIAQPEVEVILQANELLLIAGPSERGVVTLRFADDMPDSQRDAVTSMMQDDARVLFAQPVESAD